MSNFEIREIGYSLLRQFENELKNMFTINTYTYHYPDKEVDADYIDETFEKLCLYLNENNTHFIAAFDEHKIAGYIWLYQRPFMAHKRMIINSFFVAEGYRSHGIGKALLEAACQKSLDVQCKEIATHYATVNQVAGKFYLNNGFLETRVEVVKKL